MKKRYEIILLDILWLSAMVLSASFWFDIRFGFNIFYKEHWHYLMIQQLTPGSVLPAFYISLLVFIIIVIFGLYLISRPHVRKIDFSLNEQMPPLALPKEIVPEQIDSITLDPGHSPLPPAPSLPRPPRIISASQNQLPIINPLTSVSAGPTPVPVNTNDQNEKIKELFEKAGYITKEPPKINDLKLSLWAIGMDETLYIGFSDSHGGEITAAEGGDSKWQSMGTKFTSPVWTINQAVDKIRALFSETLEDEIQINIKTFVVMNNAKIINRDSLEKIWHAFDVSVFDSIDTLTEFMNNNKNRETGSEEQEDFDAYSDYIDTVANYFNKT
jgi:hypothetical protein